MVGVRELEVWLIDAGKAAAALEAIEARAPRLGSGFGESPGTEARSSGGRMRRASHIALRLLLERAIGPAIRKADLIPGPMGKPGLPPSITGSFSLSHCESHALIAISPQASIGVDLERAREIRMSPERRQRLRDLAVRLHPERPLPQDPEEAFFQAWVRIEAVAKAQGAGLGRLLTAHSVIGGTKEAAPPDPYRAVDLALDQGWFGALGGLQLEGPVLVNRLPEAERSIAALVS